ncbi:MAG: PD-(D/E)XK nuclease-like domain-containing protein [Janthinobacterium lividum]
MFTDHRHHPGLAQAAHRALPFVSNTDLTAAKNRALGITRQPNPQALAFGSHFHTAVLEPGQYQRTTQRVPWAQIKDLAAAVRRQRFCRDLLYRGQAEQTHTATHEATGLTVKVRPDLMITSPKTGRVVLVDFKTTSCPDYASFCATIERYDYDRQAALYADLLGAARFIIIGVEKKAPFEVWQFEMTEAPGLIEQGRKKYERLLKVYAHQQPRPVMPAAQRLPAQTWAPAYV